MTAPHAPGAPWHVSDALARRYADGTAAETDAWSVEKHVEACGRCAARVSAAVRSGAAGPTLAAVRTDLLTTLGHHPEPATRTAAPIVAGSPATAPVASPAGRPAAHPAGARAAAPTGSHPPEHVPSPAGRPGGPRFSPAPLSRWARLWWAVGPALRGAWVVAVVLVVGGAFGLAHGAGFQGARSLLLALSPVLPLAGVAVSYGRHADPLYEITAATPSGGLRLLLTRTAAVLAVCVPLLTAGGALLPPVAGFPGAAAWLLPGLALTLAALALGSFVGCRTAAVTLGGGWLLAVAGPLLGGPATSSTLVPYFSGPAAQGSWAAAALACGALLALRRRSFDHLEPR
ncbi:zf-HC2 domain-containing protein [Streptomyces venezuelae]|uniref:zf-HC2 domain-containing protein n=1 Tax=Streptomyces venezuelae TaxID=54571 RepID=UPI00123B2A34|nr:zf-HC2 domain-containing protein [Streptomyces venezuelae]QES08337.1 zf-HC2 domain-containing protein [Streptomyces venezuelae]